MKYQAPFVIAGLLFIISVCSGLSIGYSSVSRNSSLQNCECFNDSCGCCEYLDWSHVGINGTVCTNFSYLPNDYGISITLTYNTYTLFNETVSVRNPPPFCFGIPDLEKIQAHICLRLYDLTFPNKHFHGCAKLSISVYHVIHKSIDLGCFELPKETLVESYTIVSRELHEIIKNQLEIIKDKMEYWEFWKNDGPAVNMI